MRYLPHSDNDIKQMLSFIGKPNIKSLFNSIPDNLKIKTTLNIPVGISEIELKKELIKKSSLITTNLNFLGAGATQHFVPEIVSQILLRSEWYTPYTPYQPEVSQGTLQSMFEFQTIIANLFGCDIANASMYDGATALVEACLMAQKTKMNSSIIFMCKNIHPEYREVCNTYLNNTNMQIIEVDFNKNGTMNLNQLNIYAKQYINNIIAIVYQTPNFFGQLEEQKKIINIAHLHNAIVISINTDPLIFNLINSPGNIGADIVVGEGISFCGHLSLGGPGLGLFACSKKYLRKMPGKIVGQTIDQNNQKGYVLTLSTREQHIRREHATSNICTNHNLMALAFTIAISLYGKYRFYDLAIQNIKRTIFFRNEAKKSGLNIKFNTAHFNESVIELSSKDHLTHILHKLHKKNIFPGCPLKKWYNTLDNCLLINTTEQHSMEDITQLIKELTCS